MMYLNGRRFHLIEAVLSLSLFITLQAESKSKTNVYHIMVPDGLSADDVRHPNNEIKNRLHAAALKSLRKNDKGHGKGHKNREDQEDKIIIFVDRQGKAILPDLEMQPVMRLPSRKKISFSFDSPLYPWTPEEVHALQAALADFYPVARAIYGSPAFNLKVNIRKDPTIHYSGLYFPSLNEIVYNPESHIDVLAHEMIHAFRDDLVIALPSFEEGMTRAAEVELFNRLPSYDYWNRAHSYGDDTFYEILNSPLIRSKGGQFFLGIPGLSLVRYQLAGYAWTKGLIENPRFLADFNFSYYEEARLNTAVGVSERNLLAILASVQPSIEGTSVETWYSNQEVLNTRPATGYFLFQRSNDFVVNFFQRLDTGSEIDQVDQIIEWEVYDSSGNLLSKGSESTGAYGWIGYYPTVPSTYVGKLKLVTRASTPTGTVSNTSYQSQGLNMQKGVFGISRSKSVGSVEIVPFDTSLPSTTVKLVNGAFSIPALETIRGSFTATLRDSSGRTISTKVFNKDASNYALRLP